MGDVNENNITEVLKEEITKKSENASTVSFILSKFYIIPKVLII